MAMELHFFDPRAEYAVFERRLPHWAQPGVLCFITWRTEDSIPDTVLKNWRDERQQWLRQHAINPFATDWRQEIEALGSDARHDFYDRFSARWHDYLDAGHGACVLKQPELAIIVADSLTKFDGERYELTDFVIMPNHIHLLAAFPTERAMLEQCENWKHFQAVQINRRIGSSGRFWQQDGFDHLIRSEEQFYNRRTYIADNPRKANLASDQFICWRKDLSR
jgi:REP element-mobilizing transposase RayT